VRRLAWVPFAVALLAFALPFATVSCDDARVEPSGADLLLRTAPESEGTQREGIELGELVVAYGGGLATAAFLAFALSLLAAARGWRSGWAPLAGVAGVAALLFLKMRGGGNPGGIAEVDARLGGILAAAGGAAGVVAAAAVWLREKPGPSLRPVTPVVAASLLLFGYLFPANRSQVVATAYADTLDLTRPWDGVFWLLPVLVGVLLLAHRSAVSPNLAAFAVGVLAVAGADVADEIWSLLREDNFQPGVGAIAFFAGIVTAGAWTVANEWSRMRRPAPLPLLAGVALALLAWLASAANG
jgi:hypothetical protein